MLIKFGARWCSSCLLTTQALHKILDQYPQLDISVNLQEIDVDSNNPQDIELMQKYNINSETVLPVIITLDSNEEVASQVSGEQDTNSLKNILSAYLRIHDKDSPIQATPARPSSTFSKLMDIFK